MKSFKQYISEQHYSRDLIVVDIQPGYERSIHFPIKSFTKFLNNNTFSSIFYLYNGPDLRLESWSDISLWLYEYGLKEKVLDTIIPFEKGYAFFRSFMDLGMDEDDLIRLLRYMYENDITDSRDIEENDWNNLNLDWDNDQHGDCVYIPDVLFKLDRYNNPLICGGGRDECLREIELCFHVLNKPYQLLNQFVY